MESLAAILAATTLTLYLLGRERAALAFFSLALVSTAALLWIHSSDALKLNF